MSGPLEKVCQRCDSGHLHPSNFCLSCFSHQPRDPANDRFETLQSWCQWKRREPGLTEDILEFVKDVEDLLSQVGTFKAERDRWKAKAEAVQAIQHTLVGTLEKIADPRLRDHQEPDPYTELGCVMNMASEALAILPKKDKPHGT